MLEIQSVEKIMKKRAISRTVMTLSACLLISSCSTTSSTTSMQGHVPNKSVEIQDPFEGFNRFTFGFNKAIDGALINPITKGYRFIVPEVGRKGIRNVLRNLKNPITFANQLLQGDVSGAGDVLVRTAVNTTVGIGGIFDVADRMGFEYENEDFGQTLAVWGVGHGPYLVLPFLGPSTTRDYTGYLIDAFVDPLRIYLFNINEEGLYYAKAGMDYLDLRESLIDVLKELEFSSIDYYASVRSTYYQRRNAMVRDENGVAPEAFDIPDFDDE